VSRGSSFAEKTLLGVSAAVRDSLESARDASLPGLLQTLDPRAKLLAALALVVGVALSRSLVADASVAVLVVVLAAASRLDVGKLVRRTWLVVPLFTAALAIPAVLNVTTPGPELLRLGATPGWLHRAGWPETLAVTTTGLRTAVQLVLRVGASLSVVALVTRTTPPGELLKAIRALGVPRAFVLVATMTERYILTLAKTIEEMHLALLSRRIRPLASGASQAFVTSRMGVVLAKSSKTAEDVHLAMVARGFRGEVRTLEEPRLRGRDLAAVLVAAALAAGVALSSRAGLP
jgi:cobalt ECF transporter T component CbiQ